MTLDVEYLVAIDLLALNQDGPDCQYKKLYLNCINTRLSYHEHKRNIITGWDKSLTLLYRLLKCIGLKPCFRLMITVRVKQNRNYRK